MYTLANGLPMFGSLWEDTIWGFNGKKKLMYAAASAGTAAAAATLYWAQMVPALIVARNKFEYLCSSVCDCVCVCECECPLHL